MDVEFKIEKDNNTFLLVPFNNRFSIKKLNVDNLNTLEIKDVNLRIFEK